MFSITVLIVAVSGMAGAMLSSMRLDRVNSETTTAHEAARRVMEEVRSQDFATVFTLYNADPDDDPGGSGTAPGASFAAGALRPQANDVDGFAGQILFPSVGNQIREDVVDAGWGMPRDLNVDGVIDGLDHTGDYRMLPVRVRVQWRGVSGPRTLDLETILCPR